MLPHMQRQLRREQDQLPPPPSFSCFRTSPLVPLPAIPSLSITPATPVPTLTSTNHSPLGHAGPLQHADEHGSTSVPNSTFEDDNDEKDEKAKASTSTRRTKSLVPPSRRFHRPSDPPSTLPPPVLPFTDPFSPLSPPAAAAKSTRKPRCLFLIPLIIILLVGIAVGVAVGFSRGSQGNTAPSDAKGGVPPSSLLPSAAPATVMELAQQQGRGTTTRPLAKSVETAHLLTAPDGQRGKSAATATTEKTEVGTEPMATMIRWSATGMRMGEVGGVVRPGKGPGAARLVQVKRTGRG
ncbi:hypothetical protein JCM8547_001327 [Rhodosporidiobolus lusitaniae]